MPVISRDWFVLIFNLNIVAFLKPWTIILTLLNYFTRKSRGNKYQRPVFCINQANVNLRMSFQMISIWLSNSPRYSTFWSFRCLSQHGVLLCIDSVDMGITPHWLSWHGVLLRVDSVDMMSYFTLTHSTWGLTPHWLSRHGVLLRIDSVDMGVLLRIDSVGMGSYSALTPSTRGLTPHWLHWHEVLLRVDSVDMGSFSALTPSTWGLTLCWLSRHGVLLSFDSVDMGSYSSLTQSTWGLIPLWLGSRWVSLGVDLAWHQHKPTHNKSGKSSSFMGRNFEK